MYLQTTIATLTLKQEVFSQLMRKTKTMNQLLLGSPRNELIINTNGCVNLRH